MSNFISFAAPSACAVLLLYDLSPDLLPEKSGCDSVQLAQTCAYPLQLQPYLQPHTHSDSEPSDPPSPSVLVYTNASGHLVSRTFMIPVGWTSAGSSSPPFTFDHERRDCERRFAAQLEGVRLYVLRFPRAADMEFHPLQKKRKESGAFSSLARSSA
jgi:hypothetical protein